MAAYLVPGLFGIGMYVLLKDRPSLLEGLAVAWAAGWAAVNLASFVANQFLGIPLDGTFYGVVSLALGAAGMTALVLRRERAFGMVRGPWLPADLRRGVGLGLLLLFAGFLVFVLYKALIIWPAHPDELIYHMEIPKVAWQTGALPLQAGLDLVSQGTAYPDLVVTQQLWVYLGAGAFDTALVAPITPIYTALLVLLVFSDTRRWFGLATAGVATAALLSLFSFTSLTILVMDEVPVAFYSYLGLRFAVEALEGRGSGSRAALFVGFAGLVKYDGLAALLSLGLGSVLATRWRNGMRTPDPDRPLRRTSALQLLGFYLAAVPATLPLLVRNALRLGNPVYPYFFGGVDNQISPALLATVDVPGVVAAIVSSEAVSLLVTVLVAAVLLGLTRVRTWTATERLLLLFVAFYLPPYLSVPLLGSQIRYLAPVLPAMAIFGGRQLTWWLWESPRSRRLGGALLFLGLLGFGVGMIAGAPFYSRFTRDVAAVTVEVFAASCAVILLLLAVASRNAGGGARKAATLGLVLVLLAPGVIAIAAEKSEADPLTWTPNLLPGTRDAYLSQKLYPDWAVWTWMNANLGANATVVSFEPRVFYIEARVVSAMSPEMMPTYNMSLAQALAFLRGHGIGYVLDSQFGDTLFLNYLYVNASPIFRNLGNRTYFLPLDREGSTVLYAINGSA